MITECRPLKVVLQPLLSLEALNTAFYGAILTNKKTQSDPGKSDEDEVP